MNSPTTLWRYCGIGLFIVPLVLFWVYFFLSIGELDDALFTKKDRRAFVVVVILGGWSILAMVWYGEQLWALMPVIMLLGVLPFSKSSAITWQKAKIKYLLYISGLVVSSLVIFVCLLRWFIP